MTESISVWTDPSFAYAENECFEEILADVRPGRDGYPGYVMRGQIVDSDDRACGPRFTLTFAYADINYLNDEPSLYDLPPFGRKAVVIPGYIVSDFKDDGDSYDVQKIEYLSLHEDHSPLPFVETLLLPEEMSIHIEAKDVSLPNLSRILFYKPGKIDPSYEVKEVDPELIHRKSTPEIHQYDYDYIILGINRPYKDKDVFDFDEDLPRECILFSGTRYDVIYPDMIFQYDAEKNTATLIYVPGETTGRLIVPDTIEIFNRQVPVSEVKEILDYDCRPCRHITELNLPAGCKLCSVGAPGLRAVTFRSH